MLYDLYQRQMDLFLPMRTMVHAMQASMGWPHRRPATPAMRRLSATLELIDHLKLTHDRPAFGIDHVIVDGQPVDVSEEPVTATPFGTLMRFRRHDRVDLQRVLVVAPLSGHFATLLRNTVETLLRDHEVYVTDWHNAREVDVADGRFGFADYVDTVIAFLEAMGPDGHVMAVCQPCVQVLAAVAVMADRDHPCTPKSMTLMAGPVDVRRSPTVVNELAFERPLPWFEKNMIMTVPRR